MCPTFRLFREGLPEAVVFVPLELDRPAADDTLWTSWEPQGTKSSAASAAPSDLQYFRQTPEGVRDHKLLKEKPETLGNYTQAQRGHIKGWTGLWNLPPR